MTDFHCSERIERLNVWCTLPHGHTGKHRHEDESGHVTAIWGPVFRDEPAEAQT